MTNQDDNAQQTDDSNNNFAFWRDRCISLEKRFEDLIATMPAEPVLVPATPAQPSSNPPRPSPDFIKEFREEISQVKKGLADLENTNNIRFQAISEEIAVDRQYTRRNSILIHGYESLPQLSTFDFVRETAVELNNLFPSFNGLINGFHIDTAHPLATRKHSTKKIVLVKFKNRWLKSEIIRRYLGKPLGKPGLDVTEHLTAYTRELRASAERLVGRENVSVDDCVVYAEVTGRQYPIKYSCDLDLLRDIISSPKSPPSTGQSNDAPSPCPTGANAIPITNRFCVPHNTTEYERKYPALYTTLFFNDSNSSTKTSLKGRPSKNSKNSTHRLHYRHYMSTGSSH